MTTAGNLLARIKRLEEKVRRKLLIEVTFEDASREMLNIDSFMELIRTPCAENIRKLEFVNNVPGNGLVPALLRGLCDDEQDDGFIEALREQVPAIWGCADVGLTDTTSND